MFLSKFISDVVPQINVQKLLLEQQETIKKADILLKEIRAINKNNALKKMYEAKNTLKTPIFDMSNIPLVDKAEHFFTATDKFIRWITDPVLVMNSIAGVSFYIAAAVGITGLVFYIIGYKKGMKYVVGSTIGYMLIQIMNYGVSLL